MYVSHAVVAEMLAADARLGLPGFSQFTTKEASGVEHGWGWWRAADCAGIHGFAG